MQKKKKEPLKLRKNIGNIDCSHSVDETSVYDLDSEKHLTKTWFPVRCEVLLEGNLFSHIRAGLS